MQITTSKDYSLTMTRAAVYTVFFIAGAIFANWVARIPQVQENLGLTEGTLGFALLGGSAGVLTGLAFASGMIARYGSRTVSIGGGLLMAVTLTSIGLAFNFVTLFITLFFSGLFMSMMDVAMNAQAVEVERLLNKPIMSSFHASWSIGTFTGATIGSRFVAADFTVLSHFAIMTVVFIVMLVMAWFPLLKIGNEEDEEEGGSIFQLPPRILLPLGAIAFAAAINEGAMSDWSGIYLRDIVGADASTAALGFAAFSFAMTAMRFAGDWLTEKLSAEWIVRGGGLVSAAGVGLTLLAPNVIVTLIGIALVGVGVAVAIPLAFSAAGKLEGIKPGRAIAGVASIGYAAFLAGPPIIGLIADYTSLRFGFVLVLLMALSLWFSGTAMRVGKAKTQ